jgi:alkanesulfonate monooxygenase SsuD/methylene tetrahydromethanopterin reductase-like flavin-dependent oxidoreductase (luciferase family)
MAANLAQQVAALSQLSGGRIVGISFPPPLDVETASDAIEAYLG